MIIWHRMGFLVIPAAFLPFFLVNTWLTQGLGHDYCMAHSWPKGLAAICSAIAVGALGYWLNRREKNWGSKHRLYWLPVEYWSGIILALALYLTLAG